MPSAIDPALHTAALAALEKAVNQALAKGEAARIDAELRPLFARAAALSTASRGLFDVRVGGRRRAAS